MAERVVDYFGIWAVQPDGAKRLIEESPEWKAKQESMSDSTEIVPTQEDYMLDLEFRMTMLEMGM